MGDARRRYEDEDPYHETEPEQPAADDLKDNSHCLMCGASSGKRHAYDCPWKPLTSHN